MYDLTSRDLNVIATPRHKANWPSPFRQPMKTHETVLWYRSALILRTLSCAACYRGFFAKRDWNPNPDSSSKQHKEIHSTEILRETKKPNKIQTHKNAFIPFFANFFVMHKKKTSFLLEMMKCFPSVTGWCDVLWNSSALFIQSHTYTSKQIQAKKRKNYYRMSELPYDDCDGEKSEPRQHKSYVVNLPPPPHLYRSHALLWIDVR